MTDRVILWTVLTACAGEAMAQKRDSVFFFTSARVHAGFVITHKPELIQLSERTPLSAQLDISFTKVTRQSWEQCNCYSKTGLSFNYVDFGNREELGQAAAAVFYVEPYLSLHPAAFFSFRAGLGPAYLNKVYDEKTNPENFFYSMHLSYLITLNASLYVRVAPRARLVLTGQFNHISNGGTRTPNYGINFPTTGVGVEYDLRPQPLAPRARAQGFDPSLKYMVHAFGGPRVAKGYPGLPEVRKIFLGMNVGVLKPLGKISHLGFGAEWYYDPLAPVLQERKAEPYHEHVLAAGLQYNVFFGKMFFSPQLLHYLTARNADIDTNWYQRYFVGYRITERWFAGVGLKTHLEVADHANFTTGVIF